MFELWIAVALLVVSFVYSMKHTELTIMLSQECDDMSELKFALAVAYTVIAVLSPILLMLWVTAIILKGRL